MLSADTILQGRYRIGRQLGQGMRRVCDAHQDRVAEIGAQPGDGPNGQVEECDDDQSGRQTKNRAPGIMGGGYTGISDATLQVLMRGLDQKKGSDVMAQPATGLPLEPPDREHRGERRAALQGKNEERLSGRSWEPLDREKRDDR